MKRLIVLTMLLAFVLSACAPAATPAPTAVLPTAVPPSAVPPTVAQPAATAAPVATEAPAAEWITITDDLSAINVTVPTAWGEYNGEQVEKWAHISVSTSLDGLYNFSAPGAQIYANTGLGGYIQFLDAYKDMYVASPNNCAYTKRTDYSDNKFKGQADTFKNCNGTGNFLAIVVASPSSNPSAYVVALILNSPADEAADVANTNIKTILDSFDVVGDLPK
jgi:hypothetical protein